VSRFSQSRPRSVCAFTLAAVLGVVFLSARVAAQDDAEVPLGDVARNLRRRTPPAKPVIDDDNLSTVMDQIDSKRGSGSSLKYVMAGESRNFQIAAPDATCSLAFSANAKALLSPQYAQMDLPAAEVVKLEGPATIEGDALSISVFNHTDWHVSEVAVALTIIKKNSVLTSLSLGAEPGTVSAPSFEFSPDQVRPEKKQDTTLIYHLRAAAPPLATTVFNAPLNLDLAPGDEWHWAIVQARGYPPEGRYRETRTDGIGTEKNSSTGADPGIQSPVEPAPLQAAPVSLSQPQ